MKKVRTNITESTRFAQIMEANIYGGWVTAVTASVPEGTLFRNIVNGGIDSSQSQVQHPVQVYSNGNGENTQFMVNLEGVDFEEGGFVRGVVEGYYIMRYGSGYSEGVVYQTIAKNKMDQILPGTGFSATLQLDRRRTVVGISSVINKGSGYNVGDLIFFLIDGEEPPLAFMIGVGTTSEAESPSRRYISYALKSVEPTTIKNIREKGQESFNEFINQAGTTRFHVDEQIIIPPDQLLEDNKENQIICTVTDISYVNQLDWKRKKPFYDDVSIKVLYDKYDKKHFVRLVNEVIHTPVQGDGTVVVHDFDGVDYKPTPLPDPTEYLSFTIVDGTETENSKIILNFSNDIDPKFMDPKVYLSTSQELFDGAGFQIMDTYVLNGNIVIEVNQNDPKANHRIPRQVVIEFFIDCYDILGFYVEARPKIFNPGNDAEDVDIYPKKGYNKFNGAPYLINEAYHAVVYKEKTLLDNEYDIDFTYGNYITEIGLPFHLLNGDSDSGDILKDDEISNFYLSVKILYSGYEAVESIDQEFVNNNFIKDGVFNTKILNTDVNSTGEVRFAVDGDRYVFFQIDPFIYNGGNFTVIMYMAGSPINGGWSAGTIESSGSSEEALGFNESNNFQLRESAVGVDRKIALAFTRKK